MVLEYLPVCVAVLSSELKVLQVNAMGRTMLRNFSRELERYGVSQDSIEGLRIDRCDWGATYPE